MKGVGCVAAAGGKAGRDSVTQPELTYNNVSYNQHFDKKSDIGPKDGTVCGPQMIEEQSAVIIPPAEETIISKAVRSTFTEECRT